MKFYQATRNFWQISDQRTKTAWVREKKGRMWACNDTHTIREPFSLYFCLYTYTLCISLTLLLCFLPCRHPVWCKSCLLACSMWCIESEWVSDGRTDQVGKELASRMACHSILLLKSKRGKEEKKRVPTFAQ